MSTQGALWCCWHRSCLGSDFWLEHTGHRECSGLWLVTSAGWCALCTSQLGSTPGAECYGWPLPGVTPCDPSVTNQRRGQPRYWPITGLSLVRSPPPVGWSGTGRRLAWLWSRGGDQWVAGTRPGHTVSGHTRYREQIATDKTATKLQNIAACSDQSGQENKDIKCKGELTDSRNLNHKIKVFPSVLTELFRKWLNNCTNMIPEEGYYQPEVFPWNGGNELTEELAFMKRKVIPFLLNHPYSGPFRLPVNAKAEGIYPDYFKVGPWDKNN